MFQVFVSLFKADHIQVWQVRIDLLENISIVEERSATACNERGSCSEIFAPDSRQRHIGFVLFQIETICNLRCNKCNVTSRIFKTIDLYAISTPARVNFVFIQSQALFTEIFSQSECTIFGGIVDKFLRNRPSCGGKALFRYSVPMKIYI